MKRHPPRDDATEARKGDSDDQGEDKPLGRDERLSPATQGSATPVLVTWRDGALALGFDPAWQ